MVEMLAETALVMAGRLGGMSGRKEHDSARGRDESRNSRNAKTDRGEQEQ